MDKRTKQLTSTRMAFVAFAIAAIVALGAVIFGTSAHQAWADDDTTDATALSEKYDVLYDSGSWTGSYTKDAVTMEEITVSDDEAVEADEVDESADGETADEAAATIRTLKISTTEDVDEAAFLVVNFTDGESAGQELTGLSADSPLEFELGDDEQIESVVIYKDKAQDSTASEKKSSAAATESADGEDDGDDVDPLSDDDDDTESADGEDDVDELIDVNVTVTWDDNSNAESTRPDSDTIYLYNYDVSSVTPTDANDADSDGILDDYIASLPVDDLAADTWAGVFSDEPRYDDEGNALTYSVVEHAISGYEISTSGSTDEDGTINVAITNKLGKAAKKESTKKETTEKTNVTLVESDRTVSDFSVEIVKTDVKTGNWLEGAQFQLLDPSGNVVASWTSSTATSQTLSGLDRSVTYTLREAAAPSGYGCEHDISIWFDSKTGHVAISQGGDSVQLDNNSNGIAYLNVRDAQGKNDSNCTVSPKTGDNSNITLIAGVLVVAAAAAVIILVVAARKRKQ